MNNQDFNTLAVCSFRYALGRMTYMPSLICDILIKHKDDLADSTKELICREILNAIERNEAGWQCDIADWLKLREALYVGSNG